ncbi:MAG: molybdenum cofactor guanylyltransferase [Anaerolineae bacterium]|nr:molybdenum cofactor guanylyltransferase [Anaerolineae bacterium]
MPDFTLAIIAGGKSSRMGTDKAFIELDGKLLIEHVIERTANLGQSETILITNKLSPYARFGLPMYSDVYPEKGSLGGIYTAIEKSAVPHTLVVACDMPFLNQALLRAMIAEIRDTIDIVVPRVDGYPQGLHAIYSKTCLAPIKEQLMADRLKVIGFYDKMRVRYLDESDYETLDPDGTSFMNINTPEDLERAKQRIQ